jgi:hypothetical protein
VVVQIAIIKLLRGLANLSLSFGKYLELDAQHALLLRTSGMHPAWKSFNQDKATGGVGDSVGALMNSRALPLHVFAQSSAP